MGMQTVWEEPTSVRFELRPTPWVGTYTSYGLGNQESEGISPDSRVKPNIPVLKGEK